MMCLFDVRPTNSDKEKFSHVKFNLSFSCWINILFSFILCIAPLCIYSISDIVQLLISSLYLSVHFLSGGFVKMSTDTIYWGKFTPIDHICILFKVKTFIDTNLKLANKFAAFYIFLLQDLFESPFIGQRVPTLFGILGLWSQYLHGAQ